MPENRETHPTAAAHDKYGQREYSPAPQPADIVQNFGRPYTDPTPTKES